MNYRHWDHYVQTIAHPFVANITQEGIQEGKDIMQGQPFEAPVAPFGGIEQIAWSTDSKYIAYTSRKKKVHNMPSPRIPISICMILIMVQQ